MAVSLVVPSEGIAQPFGGRVVRWRRVAIGTRSRLVGSNLPNGGLDRRHGQVSDHHDDAHHHFPQLVLVVRSRQMREVVNNRLQDLVRTE